MNTQKEQISRNVSYYLFGIIMALGFIFNDSVFAATAINQDSTAPMIYQKPRTQSLSLQDVQRFSNAIAIIKSYYVESVPNSKLFENAIRGMLDNLDPHSAYLDESDFKELTSATNGEFGGLGIEVTMEDGLIRVIAPIDDTPAAHAGIKPGDLIVRLDNEPIRGMSLKTAVEKMRGKNGTIVNLTIIREGEKKPLSFNIVREVIHVKSVKYKLLENGYGYVRLSHFQVPSAQNISIAIKSLKSQSGGKLKGLILDLRNNPGGLLDSAIEISDLFLDSNKLGTNKLIVYTEGRVPGAHFSVNANPGDLLNNVPMVVLINQGSASAAEIVAGALQDHKRAIIVGKTSFGKGSVQTVLPLDNQTGIKLTTALYYTPLGHSIQAKGIKPDIFIDELSVQKAKKSEFIELSEAQLAGHFNNTQSSENEPSNQTKIIETDLVYHDYPLYEALIVLKGLVIAKTQ